MNKFAESKNPIQHQLFIHKMIHDSVQYCSVVTALLIFSLVIRLTDSYTSDKTI